jgi:hypothetical protein
VGWTLSPKTTPPAAWLLMATGYAGRPCSGAGPNGTIRTARASGVLWPAHSLARRLPRPRGVTPMTHPRLDSDEPAAAGPTAAAPARPATGTRPWTRLGWSHKDGHQRRRTRFTAKLGGQLVLRGPPANSDSQPRTCCTGTVPPRVWFARPLRPAGPDPSRSGPSTTPTSKWVAISVPH